MDYYVSFFDSIDCKTFKAFTDKHLFNLEKISLKTKTSKVKKTASKLTYFLLMWKRKKFTKPKNEEIFWQFLQ